MGEVALEAALDDGLSAVVDRRLRTLDSDSVVARIWARDHSVWRPDPAEIADRLGWLTAPHSARATVQQLRAFAEATAADGMTHAVLMGMGGSSLAPEVFRHTFGVAAGALDLHVLDSTHPDAIAAVEAAAPPDRTLFVAASKSGTTIETRSHLAYFRSLVRDARRFVAITDPGSPLESLGAEAGFRAVFRAPPDVGGRYSAFTPFGLLPAALIGADLDGILDEAADAARVCGGGRRAAANPGAALGAVMGEAALRGRDKLTLRPAAGFEPLGAWIEQLVAESTGKEGRGIVPVNLEPRTETAAGDRLFLAVGDERPPEPWARLPATGPTSVAAAMFVLEFATAVAGHVLEVHPFDQPDVQSAKDRTAEALHGDPAEESPADLETVLAEVRPGDYVALQAFAAPSARTWERLQAARAEIGRRTGVATTLGYGPRYLHSTGQLHKGGPPTGVFVQVLQEPREDRPVPGEGYTFGRLLRAQADGDLAALRDAGRRVGRVPMEGLPAGKG